MNSLIIFAGVYLFILSPLAVVMYMWRQPRTRWGRMSVFLLCSLALAYALGVVASMLYYNPLPYVVGNYVPLIPHEPDNGFPSHHGLFTAGLAAVGTVWSRTLGAFLWLVALLVGAGRVYGGVHHPVDILTSIFLAILATFAVTLVFKWIGKEVH